MRNSQPRLTLDQARLIAREKWGENAIATHNSQMTYNCVVADHPERGKQFHYGVGPTFEEAFLYADKYGDKTQVKESR